MTWGEPLFLSEPPFLSPEVEEDTFKVLKEPTEVFSETGVVGWGACKDQEGRPDPRLNPQPVPDS